MSAKVEGRRISSKASSVRYEVETPAPPVVSVRVSRVEEVTATFGKHLRHMAYVIEFNECGHVHLVKKRFREFVKLDKEAYVIEFNECGHVHLVKKRFREFVKLDKELRRRRLPVAELPPKKVFGNFEAAFIEARREGLESYLQRLLVLPEILDDDLIWEFVEADVAAVIVGRFVSDRSSIPLLRRLRALNLLCRRVLAESGGGRGRNNQARIPMGGRGESQSAGGGGRFGVSNDHAEMSGGSLEAWQGGTALQRQEYNYAQSLSGAAPSSLSGSQGNLWLSLVTHSEVVRRLGDIALRGETVLHPLVTSIFLCLLKTGDTVALQRLTKHSALAAGLSMLDSERPPDFGRSDRECREALRSSAACQAFMIRLSALCPSALFRFFNKEGGFSRLRHSISINMRMGGGAGVGVGVEGRDGRGGSSVGRGGVGMGGLSSVGVRRFQVPHPPLLAAIVWLASAAPEIQGALGEGDSVATTVLSCLIRSEDGTARGLAGAVLALLLVGRRFEEAAAAAGMSAATAVPLEGGAGSLAAAAADLFPLRAAKDGSQLFPSAQQQQQQPMHMQLAARAAASVERLPAELEDPAAVPVDWVFLRQLFLLPAAVTPRVGPQGAATEEAAGFLRLRRVIESAFTSAVPLVSAQEQQQQEQDRSSGADGVSRSRSSSGGGKGEGFLGVLHFLLWLVTGLLCRMPGWQKETGGVPLQGPTLPLLDTEGLLADSEESAEGGEELREGDAESVDGGNTQCAMTVAAFLGDEGPASGVPPKVGSPALSPSSLPPVHGGGEQRRHTTSPPLAAKPEPKWRRSLRMIFDKKLREEVRQQKQIEQSREAERRRSTGSDGRPFTEANSISGFRTAHGGEKEKDEFESVDSSCSAPSSHRFRSPSPSGHNSRRESFKSISPSPGGANVSSSAAAVLAQCPPNPHNLSRIEEEDAAASSVRGGRQGNGPFAAFDARNGPSAQRASQTFGSDSFLLQQPWGNGFAGGQLGDPSLFQSAADPDAHSFRRQSLAAAAEAGFVALLDDLLASPILAEVAESRASPEEEGRARDAGVVPKRLQAKAVRSLAARCLLELPRGTGGTVAAEQADCSGSPATVAAAAEAAVNASGASLPQMECRLKVAGVLLADLQADVDSQRDHLRVQQDALTVRERWATARLSTLPFGPSHLDDFATVLSDFLASRSALSDSLNQTKARAQTLQGSLESSALSRVGLASSAEEFVSEVAALRSEEAEAVASEAALAEREAELQQAKTAAQKIFKDLVDINTSLHHAQDNLATARRFAASSRERWMEAEADITNAPARREMLSSRRVDLQEAIQRGEVEAGQLQRDTERLQKVAEESRLQTGELQKTREALLNLLGSFAASWKETRNSTSSSASSSSAHAPAADPVFVFTAPVGGGVEDVTAAAAASKVGGEREAGGGHPLSIRPQTEKLADLAAQIPGSVVTRHAIRSLISAVHALRAAVSAAEDDGESAREAFVSLDDVSAGISLAETDGGVRGDEQEESGEDQEEAVSVVLPRLLRSFRFRLSRCVEEIDTEIVEVAADKKTRELNAALHRTRALAAEQDRRRTEAATVTRTLEENLQPENLLSKAADLQQQSRSADSDVSAKAEKVAELREKARGVQTEFEGPVKQRVATATDAHLAAKERVAARRSAKVRALRQLALRMASQESDIRGLLSALERAEKERTRVAAMSRGVDVQLLREKRVRQQFLSSLGALQERLSLLGTLLGQVDDKPLGALENDLNASAQAALVGGAGRRSVSSGGGASPLGLQTTQGGRRRSSVASGSAASGRSEGGLSSSHPRSSTQRHIPSTATPTQTQAPPPFFPPQSPGPSVPIEPEPRGSLGAAAGREPEGDPGTEGAVEVFSEARESFTEGAEKGTHCENQKGSRNEIVSGCEEEGDPGDERLSPKSFGSALQ
uniref:PX domain-containing protein n=1 Tax=Chromera velia CCMP2878 TaxID=1169474 RepID=A0A0G4G0E7_9ALVE|eukprot:Cvel_3973.t1-p1 / transcript=Cvel_3973.t1 / gene=Cvel_3973 / organism=Chromera_velia_CCMP2878 / gene_product=Sorting nexin-11, putative / transcript_product=Sorting nexin-11, putative / location=Cvel_scaffold168:95670-105995(+) / protein_length=1916 / sequence_SO=supercontig / SO=protein_coding / is_pseudo=false